MISLIFHFLKLWVFCNVARLHVVCQPWWTHIQKWGCVLEKCLWLQICHLFQGTNCFYLVDKLCPALRNHCLLGHSPRLFLQPAGDNPLNPRQSEDHIHCLDEKKTLNCWSCLWPQLNPADSPHFQSVCFSENPGSPSNPTFTDPLALVFVHYASYSGIRSMPHWQMIAWYAEITFWVGHNWGQLPQWWICWQHTESSACWMWQWSFSGYGPRNWTAMYGNTITRTLAKAMDIVPETI